MIYFNSIVLRQIKLRIDKESNHDIKRVDERVVRALCNANR